MDRHSFFHFFLLMFFDIKNEWMNQKRKWILYWFVFFFSLFRIHIFKLVISGKKLFFVCCGLFLFVCLLIDIDSLLNVFFFVAVVFCINTVNTWFCLCDKNTHTPLFHQFVKKISLYLILNLVDIDKWYFFSLFQIITNNNFRIKINEKKRNWVENTSIFNNVHVFFKKIFYDSISIKVWNRQSSNNNWKFFCGIINENDFKTE